MIENMPKMLDDLGDDSGPSSRSMCEVNCTIGVRDNGWRDRGERPSSGLDEVGGGGWVAERVGCVWNTKIYDID